jgi:hypothetical protein
MAAHEVVILLRDWLCPLPSGACHVHTCICPFTGCPIAIGHTEFFFITLTLGLVYATWIFSDVYLFGANAQALFAYSIASFVVAM